MDEKLTPLKAEARRRLEDPIERAEFVERQSERYWRLAQIEDAAWGNFADSGDAGDMLVVDDCLAERARSLGYYLLPIRTFAGLEN